MAQRLGNFEPVVELAEPKEDPQMYQAAGISLYTTPIQRSIDSTISFIPCVQGANVTVKVCFISNNTGTAYF